jgi:prepilin-type N-terminal cleavage/methylation domain-containing protein
MNAATVARTRARSAGGASDRGFTVMEVIVATFLFTIGLLATAQLVIVATGQVALSRQQSDAATLAARTIEQYRDIAFMTLTPGTRTTTATLEGTTYQIVTVVDATNVQQPGTDLVTVTVTWGNGRSYVTSTIIGPLQ